MRLLFNVSAIFKSEKGVTAVYVALLIPVFIGFAALVIDIGFGIVTRNELQNVADSAALAAARKIGIIYEPIPVSDRPNFSINIADIKTQAKDVAKSNKAFGVYIDIRDSDVKIGTWNPVTKELNETSTGPDTVHVIARRDDLINGPINTFFAGIWGIETIAIRSKATAAIDIDLPKDQVLPGFLVQEPLKINLEL